MHFAFSDERAMATPEGVDRGLWQAFTQGLGLAGVALPEDAGALLDDLPKARWPLVHLLASA